MSVFAIKAALWVEILGLYLKYSRSWKNTLGKRLVVVNLEAIWFEFWMKGALEWIFCLLWLVYSSQFETYLSCDTVGRELWLAILSSVLCPETDWNIRIRKVKVMCLF